MSRLVHIYYASFSGLYALLPLLGALLSTQSDESCIAKSIPGLGACRSTFCKPERRVVIR
jgi:hypothetical protein